MIPLRDYQEALDAEIVAGWQAGARNVLAMLPTGGGKTVNMAHRFQQHNGAAIGIAHRQELVGQISLALARNGLHHRLLAPDKTRKNIVRLHIDETGRSFYNPNAAIGVAGVDTLLRADPHPWLTQITLWQTDEAHHLLRANKWGKVVDRFPLALGIGWTATPGRADGYGLGREADGVFDKMVTGPTMRELINRGYLSNYRICCPPNDIDMSGVDVGANGDFNNKKLRAAVHRSRIVGDIVKTYCEKAPGQRGITFAVDVEDATKLALAYRAAGVPAEVVTADTPDDLRNMILRKFRAGTILQLVNVDLFGEGFDVPACSVVSMGRPTNSFPLYAQQFGRALRIAEGKTHGLILDHAGNLERHGGPPDLARVWSLFRRERRGAHQPADGIKHDRICAHCTAPYTRLLNECPFCGADWVPASRSNPAAVDGDLIELDEFTLAKMRGEITRVDSVFRAPVGVPGHYLKGAYEGHVNRQHAQVMLRQHIALYGGWKRSLGYDDRAAQKLFFWDFKVDVFSAMALNAADAYALVAEIMMILARAGVKEAA